MDNICTMFCGDDQYSSSPFDFLSLSNCTKQALSIFFDVVLLLTLLITMIQKLSSSKLGQVPPARPTSNYYCFQGLSTLQILSAIFNGCLSLSFMFLGVWNLQDKLKVSHSLLPLNLWFPPLFEGFTWLLVGLTLSIKLKQLPTVPVWFLTILATLFAGISCVLSLFEAVLNKQVTFEIVLDVLSVPGVILLLVLCTYKSCKSEESEDEVKGHYRPLSGNNENDDIDSVTPFSRAGWFSKISFWWLNSLMKKGREETLNEEDIPKLRKADRAESCYLMFLEQLEKQKKKKNKKDGFSAQPSLLKIIILCHWKEILISGFFALLKVLSLSVGPLLLNAFILVAEGKVSFEYEGYVLVIILFFTKCLESISQRQWYFRSRLIGVQVKSLLTAATYKKLLRLSNSARIVHSSGEIMNYVTVDAYRIGEFPFWFHQIWTTPFQICISLLILAQAIGLGTIAALCAVIFTVACNAPLSKLQNKFQTNLMMAQDERLKALSEALVNMKVLKLYAWENHFKTVVERLRNVEMKWLSAVQFQKAYNSLLFWSSPILISAASFGACYFLNVPLHANNVFTFVATLRLIQEPVRLFPDVVSVTIQAKVSFMRILKFLEAPELQMARIRNNSLPWGSPGQKMAICGEVGSGKSALLAAILGEIPNIQVYGKIAYVSQTAWIQTGTIQENILFGSPMEGQRYRETLERCSLVKDLELLPYGDLTEIGERGVNLSGGQKQRIQLARALYQNADVYFLDDPFSAVDAHTATSLFKEYVMEALSDRTVLLVTHQVDFLPAFDSVLLMYDGEILESAPYHQLLSTSQEFQDLVNAHKETAGTERPAHINHAEKQGKFSNEIQKSYTDMECKASKGDQLIKVSSDLSLVDLDVPFTLCIAIGTCINVITNLGVLAVITWQIIIIAVPTVYLAFLLQRYYLATANELMRLNGTTKSKVANHLAESMAGAITIRAFEEEERFFVKSLKLIDINASPYFHSFAANEWLIERLEILSATILASAALFMVLLPPDTFSSGFIGMALSYGLSMNTTLVVCVQNQCTIANYIVSVERLNQYMYIPSEAPEVIDENRPPTTWPDVGKVEIHDLQIRYRANTPLVLRGISCIFEGGHKIGIVGRTGSGKSTLIGALFRLVEPTGGKIIVDGVDITTIGLHDLRSRFGVIPQDPTLFNGTVRFNLDPLSQHSDNEIWEVLGKCQLKEAVQEKKGGLDSLVVDDGSNWSMGQRQLFCLGRALLRRSRILVLDEATASIDNATDTILQRTIRIEFADCTVITVAHRIPTVMDCTMVLAMSDGQIVEYDEPTKLMKKEGSLFGKLVNEYWSHLQSAESH
uniref:ABC-type xenobiotic transporter n=1 Tax=Cannabis sativa TaxID=3483 RepID=A0A803PPY8_CANSA